MIFLYPNFSNTDLPGAQNLLQKYASDHPTDSHSPPSAKMCKKLATSHPCSEYCEQSCTTVHYGDLIIDYCENPNCGGGNPFFALTPEQQHQTRAYIRAKYLEHKQRRIQARCNGFAKAVAQTLRDSPNVVNAELLPSILGFVSYALRNFQEGRWSLPDEEFDEQGNRIPFSSLRNNH